MADQTGVHGVRLDDQLSHEVEGTVRSGRSSRTEEWRDPEPAGEDQPTGDVGILPEDRRGVPEGMTFSDVERRSEIARYLGISAFPGDRDGLLVTAGENNAPERIMDDLARLPGDETFTNVQEVAVALGLGVERDRH
jgi:hypothetical protein